MFMLQHKYLIAQELSENIVRHQNHCKCSDIEVQFFAPAVARVIKSPEGVAYEKQSLSVIAKPEKVSFKADKKDNKIVLNTSELSVSVDTGTGIVSYFSKDGKSLLAENPVCSLSISMMPGQKLIRFINLLY